MKNLKFYSILVLSALFVLSACNKEGATNPFLTLSQTTLTISADGGQLSVAYKVDNPVDGSTVSVNLGNVTWITDVEITESTIDLTVEANSVTSSRTATLTVSYPGAEDVSLTVEQDALEIQYDHNYDLSIFECGYYSRYGSSGEDLFYMYLSDLGFSANGYAQVGGHYYYFYLFVESADGTSLPTGTYTATTSYGGNMTLAVNSSEYVVQYSGNYDERTFTDGSLTVSADGNTYTIEGTVTDSEGEVHRIYYTGSAEIYVGT